MGKRVKVPIRIKTAAEVSEAVPPVLDREVAPAGPRRARPTEAEAAAAQQSVGAALAAAQSEAEAASAAAQQAVGAALAAAQSEAESAPAAAQQAVGAALAAAQSEAEAAPAAAQQELEMWRDQALRLQAEMDNFRKRQRRLAEERVAAERENLLREFLTVADDLKRALGAEEGDAASLRQGVEMTYQSLLRVLKQAGAEIVEAAGQPFDPTWHEAVGTVPAEQAGVEPDTVVEVLQDGFRIGERLLRPARVIVAA